MKWPLEALTWKQICGAVAKIYKRGQWGLAKTIADQYRKISTPGANE